MPWHSYRTCFSLVGVAVLAGATLAACSSSSSSSSTPTPTQASGASTRTSPTASSGSTATARSGAPTTVAPTTAAPSGSRTLPSDVCTLLTDQEASQLAGAPVTGHTSAAVRGLFQGGTTAPCHYYGDHGTGDHPVTIYVTSFADAGAAQTFVQGQTDLYKTAAQGFQSVSGIGDEAIEYKAGSAAVVQARLGSLVLLVQGGNDEFAAPSMSALEDAAKAALGRL
jgi:hypothetical protein